MIKVQCRGSGKAVTGASFNTKRAICGYCNHMQDVRPDGKFRKHMVVTTTRKVRQGN
jgi:hypothetical protein